MWDVLQSPLWWVSRYVAGPVFNSDPVWHKLEQVSGDLPIVLPILTFESIEVASELAPVVFGQEQTSQVPELWAQVASVQAGTPLTLYIGLANVITAEWKDH